MQLFIILAVITLQCIAYSSSLEIPTTSRDSSTSSTSSLCSNNTFLLNDECLTCMEVIRTINQSVRDVVAIARKGCKKDTDCEFHPGQTKFFGTCFESIYKDNVPKLKEVIQYWNDQYSPSHQELCGYMTPMCIHGEPTCSNIDPDTGIGECVDKIPPPEHATVAMTEDITTTTNIPTTEHRDGGASTSSSRPQVIANDAVYNTRNTNNDVLVRLSTTSPSTIIVTAGGEGIHDDN